MEIKPIKDIMKISAEDLPLIVLSDNPRSFISMGIKAHQKGSYNHLMWMVQPGEFASQDLMFHLVPAEKYFHSRLKFWHNPNWTTDEKNLLKASIFKALKDPWYDRLYDWPQIVGFMVGLRGLQLPWRKICSDHVDYLRVVDPDWTAGKHRSPPEINRVFKGNDKYQVHGYFDADV